MRKIINLILFFTAVNVYSQNFIDHIIKADELYDEGKYKESVNEYVKAFEKQDGTMDPYYNAACSASLAGDKDQALTWLKKSVEKGWFDEKSLENDPDLSIIREDDRFKEIFNNVTDRLTIRDETLEKELKEIYSFNQIYKSNIRKLEQVSGKLNPRVLEVKEMIRIQDSISLEKVSKILDEKGWLEPGVVDREGDLTLFLIIFHANLETQLKYLPVFKKALAEGKIRPIYVALLEDRIKLKNGEKQIYGTFIGWNNKTNSSYVRPLDDALNVDERRSKLELPPMNVYLEKWEIKWDPKQYNQMLPDIEKYESHFDKDNLVNNYSIYVSQLLDESPLHPLCKKGKSYEESKQCFSNAVSELVTKKFDTYLVNELGMPPGSIQKVFVSFEIDANGDLINIRTFGSDVRLEEEAFRVIKFLPKIQPAVLNGTKVATYFSLPITLKVSD